MRSFPKLNNTIGSEALVEINIDWTFIALLLIIRTKEGPILNVEKLSFVTLLIII